MANKARLCILALFIALAALLPGCFLAPNYPPIAQFISDLISGPAPLFVSFDASGSHDPNDDITDYSWDFDDGNLGYGPQVSHMFDNPGSYVVTLTVSDSCGESDSYLQTIEVTAPETHDRYFKWSSDGTSWEWSMSISKSLYDHYHAFGLAQRPRCYDRDNCDWYKYVRDPYDDEYVDYLASGLEDVMIGRYGSSPFLYYATVQFALDFVSAAIPYTLDPDEWPRYPVETLVEEIGDCEDTSILFTSLARCFGQGVHLLFLFGPSSGHCAASVEVDWSYIEALQNIGVNVWYYTYKGSYYAFVETTGDPPTYPLVGEYGWPAGKFTDWFAYDVSTHIMSRVTAMVAKGVDDPKDDRISPEGLKPPS